MRNLKKAVIKLSRGPCFGACPVYHVEIRGDGHVIYQGIDHVAITGKQEKTISGEAINNLIWLFELTGFLTLPAWESHVNITCQASSTISFQLEDMANFHYHDHGDANTPRVLFYLENMIDWIVDTSQWTGKKFKQAALPWTPPHSTWGYSTRKKQDVAWQPDQHVNDLILARTLVQEFTNRFNHLPTSIQISDSVYQRAQKTIFTPADVIDPGLKMVVDKNEIEMTVQDDQGNKLTETCINNIVKSIETIWPGMSHENKHAKLEENRENVSTRLRHLGVRVVDANGEVSDEEQYTFSLLDGIDTDKLAELASRQRRLIEEFLHYSTGFILEDKGRPLRIPINLEKKLPSQIVDCFEERMMSNRIHDIEIWGKEYKDKFNACLQDIDSDVLGQYIYKDIKRPVIKLYWPVIIMSAMALDIDVEDLIVVVLIHEYAHAYTHLGKDIDDNSWNEKQYSLLDKEIKEGLAQFYTAFVSKELGLSDVFEKLCSSQHQIYSLYKDWPCHDMQDIAECVRLAMLRSRKKQITGYDEFLVEIQKASSYLS